MSVALTVVDPNGSTLRDAMDGNFTPLVNALPVNSSERTSILASLTAAESSPLLAGLFGNHDGTVEPSEVGMFASLLRDEASAIPSGTLTGGTVVSLSLDGKLPGSANFLGVTFDGAPGADSSAAPITVTSTTSDSFLPEGTTGTLVASWNFTLGGVLALPAPNATLTVTTPSATTIGTATGLDGETVHNDVWGYGPASASGTVGSSSTGSASVAFHPSFPLGDVLLVAGAVAAGVGAFLYWRRRRRSHEADDAPRG
ncbi:MAG TPA: hypothetical protein VJQ43_05940 [Thermoplasmata archaeon]|nr:hypothetical protein [Thermoplasmata archaeon]